MMWSKIVIILLAIGCLVLGILYLNSGSKDNTDYKGKIKELDKELIRKDSVIQSIQIQRDYLLVERVVLISSIDTLKIQRIESDSLRNVIKVNSHENHKRIDNASLVELSIILTGLIEGPGN